MPSSQHEPVNAFDRWVSEARSWADKHGETEAFQRALNRILLLRAGKWRCSAEKSTWAKDNGFFAYDQYFPSAAAFEEAAFPSAHRNGRNQWMRKTRSIPRLRVFPLISTSERQELDQQRAVLEAEVERVFLLMGRDECSDLMMRFYDQETLRSIGQELGCSYQAAQQRLKRAMKRFGMLWESQGPLLDARELAAELSCTPRRLRQLARTDTRFRPTYNKPRMLWSPSAVAAIRTLRLRAVVDFYMGHSSEAITDTSATRHAYPSTPLLQTTDKAVS